MEAPVRERLPSERSGVTKKIHLHYTVEQQLRELKLYITIGEYPDGRPGEVFLKVDKMGSTISGLMDALSITLSIGLQHGVPLAEYLDKLVNMRFEPMGTTEDADLPRVTSIVDAVARYLSRRYPKPGA